MTNKSSAWKKVRVEVVDQRQEKLPPTWIAKPSARAARDEQGREVLESGPSRAAASRVISLLRRAMTKVVVSSFLLADNAIEDALLETAKRGVRVYVLLASEARLGKEEGDGEFDKRVVEQHKRMLTRLGGHVLFRSAPHFHAKVVVVDPDAQAAGILLTANLTTEALERNEELAIVLTKAEVVEATEHLKWAMWEAAEHEFVDPKDRFKAVKPLGKVPHPGMSTAIVTTSAKSTSLREEALRLINTAKARIVVSSFGWDADHDVTRRLIARAREGVEVTVLARVRPSSMPALVALAEAGANVIGFKWLHAKALWTDAKQAMVMSANLQVDGLDRGFELGVRLTGTRASELLARLSRWEKGAEWRLAVAATLGDASGRVMLWQRGQLNDGEVRQSIDVELGSVTAQSAHDLSAARPNLPTSTQGPRLAHELRCTWTVAAPVLTPKATEVQRTAKGKPTSYSPPVFKEPGNRLVVAVRSADELEAARSLVTELGAAAIVVQEDASR